MSEKKKIIVFFDGVCNLCNDTVNFLIRIDRYNNIEFATLQSKIAQGIVPRENLEKLESFIVIKDQKIYNQSTAVFEVIRVLPWFYRAAFVFKIIPRPWADKLYSWIARNRYRWFGKRNECMVPTDNVKAKFLS